MGEQTNVGEVLKAGTEVVGKVFEIADEAVELKRKCEGMKFETNSREMDMVDKGLDILSKGKDIIFDSTERGLEIKANYKAEKNQRKFEENSHEMDMVDKGLDILSKGKDIIFDSTEKTLGIKENYKAQKSQRKIEKLQGELDIIEKYCDAATKRGMTPNPEVMDKFEKKLIRQIGEKEQKSKDSGSKVKEGAFAECSIEMFDEEAGIIVDRDTQEVVMLTSDNIESCKLVKHKKLNTYYYYHITFRDGQKCLVRMRKKYVDAMLNSMKDTDGVQDDSLE